MYVFILSISDFIICLNKKIIPSKREFFENKSQELIKEAKKENIAILIYGSPLIATTHISLIQKARKLGIQVKIIHNASILDAITETGLQIYKFGKIASMPIFEADSFIQIIKDNQKINSHTLILVDIDLDLKDALKKLESLNLGKIIICQSLGTKNSKIFYDSVNNLKKLRIKKPFCIIIPSKLHFIEEKVLEMF